MAEVRETVLTNTTVMPTLKVRKYRNTVYVIYTHKGKIFKIFTGVKVEDKDWNGSFPKKSCPDYDISIFDQKQISGRFDGINFYDKVFCEITVNDFLFECNSPVID